MLHDYVLIGPVDDHIDLLLPLVVAHDRIVNDPSLLVQYQAKI